MDSNYQELFETAGFDKDYYENTRSFFSEYFDNEKDMLSFFYRVFVNDSINNHPRHMMNQVVRWVELARDIYSLKPKRDAFAVACIRICIESICPKKGEEKSTFFSNNISDEGKKYICDSFKVLSEVQLASGKEIDVYNSGIREFENLIHHIRNNLVHDGDYWSTQLFSFSGVEICDCLRDKSLIYNFTTSLNFDKFIFYFVEAAIKYIDKYIYDMRINAINEN